MKEKILIALCGMSPAVITETVYALANNGNCPTKVIVITTTLGKDKIELEIIKSGVWQDLCTAIGSEIKFGLSGYHIRLIPNSDATGDANDIITTKDNTRTADFILDVLREITENPDTKIVFSIAGGRKTMSVLGAFAMSLLGREQDRLCHVLVTAPFDNPTLLPKFYFPRNNIKYYELPDGKKHKSSEAIITLCDIPFTRIRYLFQNEFHRLPGNFNDTVDLANQRISDKIDSPELKIIPERMETLFENKLIKFNAAEFTMYWMLAERAKNTMPQIYGQISLLDEFLAFVKDVKITYMPEILHHREKLLHKNDDDMRKLISSISTKIKKNMSIDKGRNACLPSLSRGTYSVALPPEYIIILG